MDNTRWDQLMISHPEALIEVHVLLTNADSTKPYFLQNHFRGFVCFEPPGKPEVGKRLGPPEIWNTYKGDITAHLNGYPEGKVLTKLENDNFMRTWIIFGQFGKELETHIVNRFIQWYYETRERYSSSWEFFVL